MARTMENTGILCYITGDYDAALNLLNKSLNIHEAIDSRYGVGMCLWNIGKVLRRQGKLAMANETLERLRLIAGEIGAPDLAALAHCERALHRELESQRTSGDARITVGRIHQTARRWSSGFS